MQETYQKLPELSRSQATTLKSIMAIMSDAICELIEKHANTRDRSVRPGHTRSMTPVEAAVAAELHRGATITDQMDPPKDTVGRSEMLVKIVVEMVNAKPHVPFTVNEIAAAARITPNHLSTIFKRYQGQSFSQFLGERRMSLAKKLLGDLTLSVAEVATRSGYEDPGYFSRCFRNVNGSSPRDWRTRMFAPHST